MELNCLSVRRGHLIHNTVNYLQHTEVFIPSCHQRFLMWGGQEQI